MSRRPPGCAKRPIRQPDRSHKLWSHEAHEIAKLREELDEWKRAAEPFAVIGGVMEMPQNTAVTEAAKAPTPEHYIAMWKLWQRRCG